MFTKLFSSITTSSIWNEDNNTRIVWVTMLAMANKHGYVSASVGGLAHEARVSREDCEAALHVLTSPDPDSRSKEFEGRRIEIVDGGFQLLNHPKYRAMRSEEERKEYMKEYMVEYRKKTKLTKNVNKNVNKVSECKPPLAQAEAEQSRGDKKEESLSVIIPQSLSTDDFKVVWNEWVKFRMTLKKSKNWNSFFTKQLAELEKWGVVAAVESIKTSLLNEYQGLFFPKNMKIKDYTISKPASIEDHLKAQGVK